MDRNIGCAILPPMQRNALITLSMIGFTHGSKIQNKREVHTVSLPFDS